jgi:hypothetical protein
MVAAVCRRLPSECGQPRPDGKVGSEMTPVVYQRAIWSLYTNSKGRLRGGNCTIAKADLLTTEGKTPDQLLRDLARKASDLAESCDVNPLTP